MAALPRHGVATKHLVACKTLLRSGTCCPLRLQGFRFFRSTTITLRLAACETRTTFKLRDTRAIKNHPCRPRARRRYAASPEGLPSGEKPGTTDREKLAFLRRFSRFFIVPCGRLAATYLKLQAHTLTFLSLACSPNAGPGGSSPWFGGPGTEQAPGGPKLPASVTKPQ